MHQTAEPLLKLVLIKQEEEEVEEDFTWPVLIQAEEANHSSDLKQATKEGALPEEDQELFKKEDFRELVLIPAKEASHSSDIK